MAVTQMIIVAFAVTVFLIGAILGLRFRVVVLIAPVIVGFVAIVAVGIASGNGAGLILFVVFLGLTALQLGYVAGAVIRCFATKSQRARGLGRNHRDRTALVYRRSQG
jgi:hypothetical protein